MFNLILIYLIIPIFCLWGMRINRLSTNVKTNTSLISKDMSLYIRGVATIGVVLCHFCIRLQEEERMHTLLKPIEFLGPLGVSLFFILSGYGLYLSSGLCKLHGSFIIKRLKSVYLPFVIILALFFPFHNILELGISSVPQSLLYLLGFKQFFWFVTVITLLYIIYYFVSLVSNNPSKNIVILFIATLILCVILHFLLGENYSYWYGNNLCFPLGVLIAYKKDLIKQFFFEHYKKTIPITFVLLVMFSIGYYLTQGLARIIDKSFLCTMFCMLVIQLIQFATFNNTAIKWIGKNSLYIYIIHTNIYIIMRHFLNMSNPVITCLYFAIVLLFAYILNWIFKNTIFKTRIR